MALRTFLDPTYIEHEVLGEIRRFYPARLKTAFKLKSVGRPLARAFSTLFSDTSADNGKIYKDMRGEDGTMGSETVIEPMSIEMARMRHEQRAQAIEDMIHQFTDDKNARLVAEIILDSLRDEYTWKQSEVNENRVLIDEASISQIVDELDLSAFMDLLKGVALANKEVFGPMGEKMAQAVKGARIQGMDGSDLSQEAPQTAG